MGEQREGHEHQNCLHDKTTIIVQHSHPISVGDTMFAITLLITKPSSSIICSLGLAAKVLPIEVPNAYRKSANEEQT